MYKSLFDNPNPQCQPPACRLGPVGMAALPVRAETERIRNPNDELSFNHNQTKVR
jgi:hypothetical protein